MTSLTQSLIETMLSDSRFTSLFPDFVEAKRRLMKIANSGSSGSCCADRNAATQVNDVRETLSWLKRTVANWPKEKQTQLLGLLGVRSLSVSYNNPASRTIETKVLEK